MADRATRLQRADRLKEPPVVGRFYLVPAIKWVRHGLTFEEERRGIIESMQTSRSALWWPVWGHKHDDVEFFNFKWKHYHADPRFFSRRHWNAVWEGRDHSKLSDVQARPLSHVNLEGGPPKPALRKMLCTMAHSEWMHSDKAAVIALNERHAGEQCTSGKRGFVCPHKHFALGPVQAIDGVITCPLHGLRIDAATGKCIGPKQPVAPAEASS